MSMCYVYHGELVWDVEYSWEGPIAPVEFSRIRVRGQADNLLPYLGEDTVLHLAAEVREFERVQAEVIAQLRARPPERPDPYDQTDAGDKLWDLPL